MSRSVGAAVQKVSFPLSFQSMSSENYDFDTEHISDWHIATDFVEFNGNVSLCSTRLAVESLPSEIHPIWRL